MAHVPPSPAPFDPHSAASLALQASDDIDSLHDVRLAYACIEQLVVPQHASDSEDAHPIRTELSALMRLVNDELQRRIETTEATMQSLRLAVDKVSAAPC
jgi:arsenate reductase-like glutaredoxin family protein